MLSLQLISGTRLRGNDLEKDIFSDYQQIVHFSDWLLNISNNHNKIGLAGAL